MNLSASNLPVEKKIYAIACFLNSEIKGTVRFEESLKRVKITLNITGLTPTHKHGFHVHQAGDLSEKCMGCCDHFNPTNKKHGCPGKKERHVGDLGNIQADKNGSAKYIFYDNVIRLGGKNNIIGRGLVIHADEDDCGEGGNEESLKTGNAGKRIGCAVIGFSKENFC
jgi:Cu-Zn family superoxide dismutase